MGECKDCKFWNDTATLNGSELTGIVGICEVAEGKKHKPIFVLGNDRDIYTVGEFGCNQFNKVK
jgi:hypothetical protein